MNSDLERCSEAEQELLALDVRGLSVGYNLDAPALWDVSFKVPQGKLVGILGPNGAGKTTFVKAITGLIEPLCGQILVNGKSQSQTQIGYVPQKEEVDWDFPATALDVVLMGCFGRLGLFRRPSKADRREAMDFLRQVGMESFAKRHISHLSEGQKQRVFIARMLMQKADIYFMDEPFSGIDMASEKVIIEILKKLQTQGKTIFIVHHDLLSASNYFDWSIFLNVRLMAAGPMDEVFNAAVLEKTFGKGASLLCEATHLSEGRRTGVL